MNGSKATSWGMVIFGMTLLAVGNVAIGQSTMKADQVLLLQWPSLNARTYAVDLSQDLSQWTTIISEIKGTSSSVETLLWVAEPSSFYRIRKAPNSVFEPPLRHLEETGAVDWENALTWQHFKLTQVFDGKDLAHWRVPPLDAESWVVDEGILKVKSGPEQRASTLWTKRDYTGFVMTFDFRFGEGSVDSGIFIRGTDQIQIGISRSLQWDMTASPYIPGTGYPVEAEGVQTLLKLDDWNSMRIEALGPTYVTWLNDRKVATYTSKTSVEKGPIGIQLHGNLDMAIDYRRIQIASLDR